MTNRRLLPLMGCIASLSLFSAGLRGQSELSARIQKVMDQPEFSHSHFGIEICDLTSGKRIYALNENKFFVPASTTKLLTEGTALQLLGQDYRFHTRVYWTGKFKSKGILEGDIVLVASGDPNLSGRIQPDGTLAFEDEDHSYGGLDSKGLAGDPLMVIGQIADQIASQRYPESQRPRARGRHVIPGGHARVGNRGGDLSDRRQR